MPVIRNKLNQRIVINLKSGKNIELLAKGLGDVSEDDVSSDHLQAILSNGDITISGEQVAKKPSHSKKGKNLD